MVLDRWPSRRQAIRQHTARLNDRLRAAEDTRLIASLTGLRDTLVAAAGSELPFRSAEGAVFSLAALQKVIDRLSRSAVEESGDFSQENLDMVVQTLLQVLREDEEVGPALDRRMPRIIDIIESRLSRRDPFGNDQPVRRLARQPARPPDGLAPPPDGPLDGPDGQVKGMGRP